MPRPNTSVHQYTLRQLAWLEKQRNDSQERIAMAHLRRGIGHAPGELLCCRFSSWASYPSCTQPRSYPSCAVWSVYTSLPLLWQTPQRSFSPHVREDDVTPSFLGTCTPSVCSVHI